MAGPWEQYAAPKSGHPALLYRAPAKPATPPSGYAPAGSATPLAFQPGGPYDPAQAARVAAAEASARVNATQPVETAAQMRLIQARAATELATERAKNAMPTNRGQTFDNVAQMRKELEGRNSVQVYKNALPSYASALKSPDTPAGDQDLIYAFAKIMDPNSVVREGEAAGVAALGSMDQQMAGAVRKQLASEGKLTPDLRAQMRNTLANRMGAYNKAYNSDRSFFRDVAKRNGLNADDIIGPHLGDSYAAIENEYFRHDPNKSAAAARAEAVAGRSSSPSGSNGPLGSLATGATHAAQMDPKSAALVTSLIKNNLPDEQINGILQGAGIGSIAPENLALARKTLANGGALSAGYEKPNSLLNKVAASPVGVGVGAAVDAGMGGFTDELGAIPASIATGSSYSDTLKRLNDAKQASFTQRPLAAGVGGVIGGTGVALLGGALLKGTAAALSLGRAAPFAGAAVQGGAMGAGQNNGNRLDGAGLGIVGGIVGTGLGQLAAVPVGALARTAPAQAAINKTRGMFGRSSIIPAGGLSPAEQAAGGAISKAGPDDIRGMLDQASSLNVPMSLADTVPELTELGGSAVRRSPTAARVAENALVPRSRGQIDRLGNAVARDLGPVANVPQTSADLMEQARSAARPLYERAYSNPGASSVKLDDLMNRPSMKAGLARARNIALEEGRDPTTLGFSLNGQGEVELSRVPSFQTLDYVKRGLDDTLEQHRNLVTGKLELNEATRAINGTKNDLLSRVDTVNPDYAAARKAYAGPVQSKDALARGQDAFSLSPDELAMQVADQSPEHLAQMQTGFRSQLMNRANNVRDVSNPWEATLGTPNARARIDALHPNKPGTDNLFATRDLEKQIADSHNRILGNSATAQRQIADNAFAGADLGDMAGMGIDMLHGGVPVTSIAKAGLKRAGLFAASKRAVSKADDLAPMLFNTDPSASKATVDDILKRMAERQAYVQRMRPTQGLGMFGQGAGAAFGSGY